MFGMTHANHDFHSTSGDACFADFDNSFAVAPGNHSISKSDLDNRRLDLDSFWRRMGELLRATRRRWIDGAWHFEHGGIGVSRARDSDSGFRAMARLSGFVAALGLGAVLAAPASARSPATDATGGMSLFADHCFSPFLTAAKAKRAFNLANLRHDFYDLDPFSDVEPSPASGDVTPGTDRRCEVAFDGDYGTRAAEAAVTALSQERILTEAGLPAMHEGAAMDGTVLLAARQLNPARIAVAHVGTRPGPNGIETFMTVERLRPQQ